MSSSHFPLRPYQTRAVAEVEALREQGVSAVCLQAPTGSGKTVMALALIAAAIEREERVMFLAPRRELIHQAADKLERLNLRHGWDFGIIMAGVDGAEEFASCPIQVASKDTLRSRIRRQRMDLPPAGLVIVDEAHLCLSRTWAHLLDQYAAAGAFIVGLTATPARGDGRGLGRRFDALVSCPSVQALTNQGFLVDARYFAPSEVDLVGIRTDSKTGDYARGELERRVNRTAIVGDIVDHWLQHAGNRRTVVFCAGVQHSLHVARTFDSHGIAVAHVDGGTPIPDRNRIFDGFRSGEIQVLTNCDVATYGFDLPEIDCIVLARPTKSLVLHLQMLGRGLRPAPGKDHLLVLDHGGNVNRLGFAHDAVPWTLDDDGKVTETAAAIRKAKGEPTTCPKCSHVYRGQRECPSCGWEPKRKPRNVRVREGELVELNPREDGEDRKRFYLMLRGHAVIKGYREGWAFHKYRERYGVSPPWEWKHLQPRQPDEAVQRYIKHLAIKWAKRRGAA